MTEFTRTKGHPALPVYPTILVSTTEDAATLGLLTVKVAELQAASVVLTVLMIPEFPAQETVVVMLVPRVALVLLIEN